MNISACLVTRGDVDMRPVLDSLPADWEVVLWTNAKRDYTCEENPPRSEVGQVERWPGGCDRGPGYVVQGNGVDMSVYGRYEAIKWASHSLVYTQDDDVIVSDPKAIVDAWLRAYHNAPSGAWEAVGHHVVCNMPQEFRHDGYTDSALVGFGAAFHRDAPAKAFAKLGFTGDCSPFIEDEWWNYKGTANGATVDIPDSAMLRRTCDVVFTTLTPRVLVDVPKTDREFASAPNRMWKQPDHVGERAEMLRLSRKVRDA